MKEDSLTPDEKKLLENREPIIEMTNLAKRLGAQAVLKDVNLNIYPGENVVVMGRSGTGKTVLIKHVVALMKPDAGTLRVFGKEIFKLRRRELNELRTRIGFVFQNSALYDSMTVRQNLEFPLRRRRVNARERNERVKESLKNVGLEEAINKLPEELSGGMRKRAGIARSLMLNPEIVLYDEPTAGLDPITSEEIIHWILEVRKKYQTTSIIVSHDIYLAQQIADRVVFLQDGVVYAQGTFEEMVRSNDKILKPFFKLARI